jgi:tetratricopeptide (TPR) repeat protein/TolB-like protein
MLVAVLVWIRRPTDPASPSAAAPLPLPTLAIIPPAKLGGEPSDDYLVSAFTEELGAMLNRTRGVSVPGYLSTALLAKRGVAPRVIGDSLGAGYVLEGTLGARADTVIIGLQLSRVADNGILWSSNFSGSTGDLGRIERDVADSLLRVLHPTKRMVSTSQLLTSNPEAANLYRRARFKWSQREKASLNDALVDLNGAIQLDPNFAMAYASMAEVYVNLSNFGFLKQSEALTSATLAADKALSLDSVLAPALASRGFVLASQGRYAEAEASLRRSIGLNPDIQWSHHYYSLLLTMLGRFKEATNEIETALKLDPLARPAKTQLGVLRQAQGDLNGAREQLRKALAIAPDFQLVLSALGEVEAALGDYRAALPLLERANELSPDFPTVRGDLAYVYDKLGQTPKSRRLLTEARRAVTDDRSRVNYALTLGVLGQADSAFTLLRSAVWDVPTLIQLRVDPLLRDFRADPRYPKLLAQFGLTP